MACSNLLVGAPGAKYCIPLPACQQHYNRASCTNPATHICVRWTDTARPQQTLPEPPHPTPSHTPCHQDPGWSISAVRQCASAPHSGSPAGQQSGRGWVQGSRHWRVCRGGPCTEGGSGHLSRPGAGQAGPEQRRAREQGRSTDRQGWCCAAVCCSSFW